MKYEIIDECFASTEQERELKGCDIKTQHKKTEKGYYVRVLCYTKWKKVKEKNIHKLILKRIDKKFKKLTEEGQI